MARHLACPSWVFWPYKKVGGPGDVVIQKRCVAIVDKHAPVNATHVSVLHPHRNQTLVVRPHQGECQLMPPGLCRTESVSSRFGVMCKGRTRLVG